MASSSSRSLLSGFRDPRVCRPLRDGLFVLAAFIFLLVGVFLSTCSYSSFSSRCLACRLLPLPLLFRVLSFPPSSFFSSFVSLFSASLFFAFFFSPFSSPRAECGALNTHLGPFVFFLSFFFFSFPFFPFSFPRAGCGALNTHLTPSFSLSLSFFLSFFFSSLFSNYFLVFLFARLGMACSWCRSSTLQCSFSTRFRRVFWAV